MSRNNRREGEGPIRLWVGTEVSFPDGRRREDLRPVTFTGQRLAEVQRGSTETLYRTADGRLVVYIHQWSPWGGEPDIRRLVAVTEEDLGPTGRYRFLGREARLHPDLTVDEAISIIPE